MKRRDLLKGLAVLPFLAKTTLSQKSTNPKIIKPKRLKKGDTVALITPSSGVTDADFKKAVQNMADLGFKTKVGKYATAVNGFLAGTDAQRLEDLHWAFSDKTIDAVWCIRGAMDCREFCPKSTMH